MSSEEEKFECPLCGIFGLEGEILNHLESCDGIKKETLKTVTPANTKYFRALQEHIPNDNVELKLQAGDIITVIGKVDDDWWKGELDGEVGLFKPAICEPTDQPPNPKVDEFLKISYNPRKNPRPALVRGASNVTVPSSAPLRKGASNKLLDLGLVRVEKIVDSYLAQRGDEAQFIAKLKASFQSKKETVTGTIRGKQKDIIFIVGNNRFYAFKDSGKVKHDIHIADIQEITSVTSGTLTIRFQGIGLILYSEKLNEIADALHICWLASFPTRKFPFNAETINLKEKKFEVGSCGGYKQSYLSLCDYFGVPVSMDLCFDVDTIYGPHDIKEFNLAEFDLPKLSTGREMIEALRANTWFETLKIPMNYCSKLSPDSIVHIADMLRQNNCIKVLEVTHVSQGNGFSTVGKDFAQNKSLLTVNFSNSLMEDKGLISLSTEFFAHSQNLTHIDISSCAAEKKGMCAFFKALQSNQLLLDNLRKLNISNNRLDGDGSSELGIFLSKSKALIYLDMANTSPNYTNIVNKAPNRKVLAYLDISHNKISKKEASILGRLLSTMALTDLKLVSTKLDYSKVDHLKSILTQVRGLKLLDISDNELGDEGFLQLRDFLVGPASEGLPSLTSLYINRCISVKGKYTNRLVDGLTDLVSHPTRCPIEVLHVAGDSTDSKFQLRGLIVDFLLNLLVNETLLELNITSHKAGDALALTMAKVVQANKKLEKLFWDDNDLTSLGYKKFKVGLQRNTTLIYVSYPFHDLNLKSEKRTEPDTDKVLSFIQNHVVSAH